MIKIAVDAMGGDYAPRNIVHGAVDSARNAKDQYEIILVGDKDKIEDELIRHFRVHFPSTFRASDLPLSVVHASQHIEMGESPLAAIKAKPDSSIAVALQLHKDGKANAMVSAGNTGAVMASALFRLGRIAGVNRPGIGQILPGEGGRVLLTDVGANVDSKPINLLQFGIMGSVFFKEIFNVERPTVALLNVGHEESKGNDLVKKAYILFQNSNLNFIGNIEGRDIMRSVANVVVCDGFVGNIVLKFAESFHKVFGSGLRKEIGKRIFSQLGAFMMKPSFDGLRKVFDYQEYGGAPLLGVNGICIIAHGRSTPHAVRSAIREAFKAAKHDINEQIRVECSKRHDDKE